MNPRRETTKLKITTTNWRKKEERTHSWICIRIYRRSVESTKEKNDHKLLTRQPSHYNTAFFSFSRCIYFSSYFIMERPSYYKYEFQLEKISQFVPRTLIIFFQCWSTEVESSGMRSVWQTRLHNLNYRYQALPAPTYKLPKLTGASILPGSEIMLEQLQFIQLGP